MSGIIREKLICKSLQFDGVNDYLEGPLDSLFELERTQSFSFGFNVKPITINSGTSNMLLTKYSNPPSQGYFCSIFDTGVFRLDLQRNGGGNGISVRTVQTLNTGEWYHLIATYDGSSSASGVNLYIDGVLQSTTIGFDNLTDSIINSSVPLRINTLVTPSRPLNSDTKLVRMWNKELSFEEITKEYNNGFGRLTPISKGNCILDIDLAKSIWDGSKFLIKNGDNITSDFESNNITESDLINGCYQIPTILAGSPTIDSISGGSEQALIYYTTGTAGTNPIIDYEYSLNSGSTWVSLSSTDNPLIVTGLTNGTTYYIQIRPITIDGAGGDSNIVSVTPQGIPWEPDDVNIVAWIDASDTSSYTTVGSTLTSVTDKAGTYTMNIGNTPTVVSGGLNSLNVFDFDGNGEYLQSSTYSNQTSSGNHWAIGVFLADFVDGDKDSFWSYETNQTPKRDYAVSSAGGGSNSWPGELDLDALSSNRISSTIGNKQDWNLQSVSIDSWVIVSCWFNKTGNQIGSRVNGNNAYTPVNDYDNSISSNQELRLMRNRASQELDGRLAEFFSVSDLPGTGGTDLTDLEKAEGYLAWKWGLEGLLPVSHPYKNSPPTL